MLIRNKPCAVYVTVSVRVCVCGCVWR